MSVTIVWIIPADQKLGALIEIRSPYSLRCGALTLREKVLLALGRPLMNLHYPSDIDLHPRFLPDAQHLKGAGGEESLAILESFPSIELQRAPQPQEDWLWIDASTFLDRSSWEIVHQTPSPVIFTVSDRPVLVKTPPDIGANLWDKRVNPLAYNQKGGFLQFLSSSPIRKNHQPESQLPRREISGWQLHYPWDLIEKGRKELENDITLLSSYRDWEKVSPSPEYFLRGEVLTTGSEHISIGIGTILNADPHPIYIENDVIIEPGAVLNSKSGPIWIGSNTTIQAGAILNGPIYIGSYSIIRPGARINGAVSLGPHSRVGGELAQVTVQGYSNKQHGGYLGTSYIGEWVNLGAGTDNSDLKNNYQPIALEIEGQKVKSDSIHLGVFIGDYTRTAIGCRLNSGSLIGTSCNIIGSYFPPKTIPPFIWLGEKKGEEYQWNKAIETIKVMMSRRGASLSSLRLMALERLYGETRNLREQFLTDYNSSLSSLS